jgi:hypothetical protein
MDFIILDFHSFFSRHFQHERAIHPSGCNSGLQRKRPVMGSKMKKPASILKQFSINAGSVGSARGGGRNRRFDGYG